MAVRPRSPVSSLRFPPDARQCERYPLCRFPAHSPTERPRSRCNRIGGLAFITYFLPRFGASWPRCPAPPDHPGLGKGPPSLARTPSHQAGKPSIAKDTHIAQPDQKKQQIQADLAAAYSPVCTGYPPACQAGKPPSRARASYPLSRSRAAARSLRELPRWCILQ